MADPHLLLGDVTKTFSTPGGQLPVLEGIDLSLSRGEALVITGPSGSGKSTLLYIVGTLETPTAGTLSVLGEDPFALDAALLAQFRNRQIGFVFQDHHLLPQCTVLENVLIPALAGQGAGAAEEQHARELLDRVGLAGRITHLPAQLSGGERQRVAVCRALINQPALLLADEPTGNLDRNTAESVGALLLELSQEHNTMMICVTHSTELAGRFSRQMQLQNGKLLGLPM